MVASALDTLWYMNISIKARLVKCLGSMQVCGPLPVIHTSLSDQGRCLLYMKKISVLSPICVRLTNGALGPASCWMCSDVLFPGVRWPPLMLVRRDQ